MTQVKITEDGNRVKITLKGHADYDTEKDVVCAGVSTLTYGIANYLYGAGTRGKLENLDVADHPGDVEITFEIVSFPEWAEIRAMILDSFLTLEESYPSNVRVNQ